MNHTLMGPGFNLSKHRWCLKGINKVSENITDFLILKRDF